MDSGGPVLWENPMTKKIVLVGIISNGADCGGPKPGINTHVGSFIDFIKSHNPQGNLLICQLKFSLSTIIERDLICLFFLFTGYEYCESE